MLSGIPSFFQSISALPMAKDIQPGEVYAGVVRLQNSALVLSSGSLLIPLDGGSGLTVGQRVNFQFNSTPTGLQLAITPQTANAPTQATSPDLSRVLAPILETLGKLELAPRIQSILPRELPATSGSLQPLLTVLLSKQALGADLDQFSQIVASVPANSGGLAQSTIQAIAQWLGLLPPTDRAAWHALLLRSREEQMAAARIAALLKPGADTTTLATLKESAASLATRLLDDPAFLKSLKEDGQLEPFKALAQRFQERATGVDLQNLRGLDQAYQFIELPVREAHGFHRAQLHNFRENTGQGKESGTGVSRTVLDLKMTQLGALWVSLQRRGEQCTCEFRVADPEVAALLQSEGPNLEAALAEAGFSSATVTTLLWDGSREEALIRMLAPFQKLDLEI
jgi:hypothetical protein